MLIVSVLYSHCTTIVNIFFLCVSNRNKQKKYSYARMQIPEEEFKYAKRVYYCTHGIHHKPRGTGKRTHTFRWTKCQARITAYVTHDEDNGYRIHVKEQVRFILLIKTEVITNTCMEQNNEHNHYVTKQIFDMYSKTQSISDEILLGKVDLLVKNNVPMRNLTVFISDELGTLYDHCILCVYTVHIVPVYTLHTLYGVGIKYVY